MIATSSTSRTRVSLKQPAARSTLNQDYLRFSQNFSQRMRENTTRQSASLHASGNNSQTTLTRPSTAANPALLSNKENKPLNVATSRLRPSQLLSQTSEDANTLLLKQSLHENKSLGTIGQNQQPRHDYTSEGT